MENKLKRDKKGRNCGEWGTSSELVFPLKAGQNTKENGDEEEGEYGDLALCQQ